jgi:hypothetical protein
MRDDDEGASVTTQQPVLLGQIYCKQAWWLERVIHTAMDDTASIDSLSSDFASQQKRTFALCNSRLALASNAREGS